MTYNGGDALTGAAATTRERRCTLSVATDASGVAARTEGEATLAAPDRTASHEAACTAPPSECE